MSLFQGLYNREIDLCIGESIVARQLFDSFSERKNRPGVGEGHANNDSKRLVSAMLEKAKELVMSISLTPDEFVEPSYETADVCIQALSNVRDNAVSRNENRAGISTILGVFSLLVGFISLAINFAPVQYMVRGHAIQIAIAVVVTLLLVMWIFFVSISRKAMLCVLGPCNEMMGWFYLLKMSMRIHAVGHDTVILVRKKFGEYELCENGLLKDGDQLEITYNGEVRKAVVHFADGELFFSDEANPSCSAETLNSLYHQMFPKAKQRNVMDGFKKGNQTINDLKDDLGVKLGLIKVEYVD